MAKSKPKPVVTTHADPPPNPDLMGWGDKTLNDAQKRAMEAAAQDALPIVCGASEADGAGKMLAKIEALIRGRFKFDKGWDTMVAERIVYGLADDETLMVPQNMGNCFPPGTLIRLADGSLKPIEEIRWGDKVATAEGRTGDVTRLMARGVNEPIYRIKLWGHDGLALTSEHPILTARGYVEAKDIRVGDEVAISKFAPPKRYCLIQVAEHSQLMSKSRYRRATAHRSVFAKGGGRRLIAVQHAVPDCIELNEDFGRLAGLYLAEGSSDHGRVTWSFCADERDTLVAETVSLIKTIFGVDASVSERNRGSTIVVTAHSRPMEELFVSLCGSLAGGKRLHRDLSSAPDHCLRAMFFGWIAGDGHERRNQTQGTTVSKRLALDMFSIASALGLKPTFNRTECKPTGNVKSRQTRYDVFIATESRGGSWHCRGGESHDWRKVRGVEQIDYSGPVYNFSVSGDESYVADGVGVHNCVGDSHCCLLAGRIAHEILAIGDAEEPLGEKQLAVPFIPYSYGVGRWVGGMLGPGDGSYCGAQIEGTMKHGFLPCFTPGLDKYGSLPQSSASVGRLFGKSKAEIEKWTDKASLFDLLEAPKCKTVDEFWDLVVEKQIPLQICSGTMPTFWKNDDKYGIPLYRMGEPASHSTQLVAGIELKGARFAVGRNQWGYGAHKGAPSIGIPGGCYTFPIEELAKWLPKAETIGIGSIKGLEINPGA